MKEEMTSSNQTETTTKDWSQNTVKQELFEESTNTGPKEEATLQFKEEIKTEGKFFEEDEDNEFRASDNQFPIEHIELKEEDIEMASGSSDPVLVGCEVVIMPPDVSVTKLKRLKFSQLTLQEKIKTKTDGRPTPEIQITQPGMSNSKKYIRSFNPEWYAKKSWLCGCEANNALFCFPCLLLGGDSTWTENGFTNINKMKEKTERHECSRKHIDNVISLSLLECDNIREKLSEAYRLSLIEHNSKVAKNRAILSKIIDCIKLYGDFEIPICLRERDEEEGSLNPGVFCGLLHFASELDADLKNHLESNPVFKGVSKPIQNDILDCLLLICRNEIKKEIKETSFVAVIADDTTDVSETTKMVIVLRYELNGEIVERFWGFFNPENQTTDGLSKCILDQLNIVLEGNVQKLIAQTFDGPIVMKGKKSSIKAKIKEVYKNAHFIHCYSHQVNLILKSAASTTRNSRLFFANLLAVSSFFSTPQRLSILNKHSNSLLPRPSSRPIKGNFNIRTIYENFESIKKCVVEIQSTFNSDKTISEATLILHILNDEKFVFWLKLFHQILPLVEVIYNKMQSRQIDAFKVHECVANFKKAITELRNSKYCENPSKTLSREAKEICECLSVDINERYSFTKHLLAAKLFGKEQFKHFKKNMPLETVAETIEAYPMIEKAKLLTELQVFYSRPDMHNYENLMNLLKCMTETNLTDVLSELTKLIQILLTIPMTTAEPERCFSTLKRIKSFLNSRPTMHQEPLNSLAMISMEKSLINKIPNLNEKVINLFAQNKAKNMDFTFK